MSSGKSVLDFNPRSDERSDTFGILFKTDIAISIHAPTNGATYISCLILFYLTISIHAPTNGATVIQIVSGI